MATIIKEKIPTGGIESRISSLAVWFYFFACLFFAGSLIVFFATSTEVESGYLHSSVVYNWTILIGGVLGFISCLFFGAVSNVAANHIRLLKKIAGVSYSGEVSPTGSSTITYCSKCGKGCLSGQAKCHSCYEKFEEGADKPTP